MDGNQGSTFSPSLNREDTIYAIIHRQIEKLPYNEDADDGMAPCYRRIYSESTEIDYEPERDIEFLDMTDLIQKYYDSQGLSCPIPIVPYGEVLTKHMAGADGEDYIIVDLLMYLAAYGLEFDCLYFIREVSVVAGMSAELHTAETFLVEHRDKLRKPEIVPVKMDQLLPDGLGCLFY